MHTENLFLINSILASVGFEEIESTLKFNVTKFVKRGLALKALENRTIYQELLLRYLLFCGERCTALSDPSTLNNYKESYVSWLFHQKYK